MNCKSMLMMSVLAATAAALAAPTVTQVTFEQDLSRQVKIGYRIDEPAVVTVDVQTNRGDGVFVSIGEENTREMIGAVNRLVTNTETANVITWRPDLYWNQGNRITGDNVKAVVTAWATNAPPDWLVINVATDPAEARYYVSTNAMPFAITDKACKTEKLVMRRIHATNVEWRMGSPVLESGRDNLGEEPRTVWLTQDYYIGIYLFTVGQYKSIWETATPLSGLSRLAGEDPDCCPLNGANVTYNQIRVGTSADIDWPNTTPLHKVGAGSYLETIRNRVGFEMDLPTEAQWEFACRAGTTSGYYNGLEYDGEVSANLDPIAWYAQNAGVNGTSEGCLPHEVGTKLPNNWLLYDMAGNVQERCLDYIEAQFDMTSHGGADPKGLTSSTGGYRVIRGGAYGGYKAQHCRSAWRGSGINETVSYGNHGFRVVCPAMAVR